MTDPSDKVNARLGIYGGHSTGESWRDNFRSLQQPRIDPGDDPLAKFVTARIIELETEPRGEIDAVYDLPAGPVAYRYAKHVRADCVAFRQIVALYVEPCASPSAKRALRDAVLAVANRWADHREFQTEWWRIQ
jgi:hypothetical protein